MVECHLQTKNLKANVAQLPERLARAICFLCGQLQVVGLLYVGVSKFMSLNADYHEDATAAADTHTQAAGMNQLAPIAASINLPALIAAAGDHASRRFLEFFAANIRNAHTRRAYSRAVAEFLTWCAEGAGVRELVDVEPLHVATWIEMQTKTLAAPSVKQRLAAIRHLFDWLVTGQVVATNPAASVRGPSHVVRQGKTSVLDTRRSARADRQHRRHDAGGPARSGADRAHGVQLRADSARRWR